jgi:hypothetical protein
MGIAVLLSRSARGCRANARCLEEGVAEHAIRPGRPAVARMEGRSRIRIDEDLGGLELIEAVHDRPYFARHAHPTYAVGLVQRGANRFRYRGAFHTAAAGALCTVTPDEAHAVEPASGAGFAYRCLYPPVEMVRLAAESLRGGRVSGTLALPPVIEDAVAARSIRALFEAEEAGAPRLARETRLLTLLARIVIRHAMAPIVPGPIRSRCFAASRADTGSRRTRGSCRNACGARVPCCERGCSPRTWRRRSGSRTRAT